MGVKLGLANQTIFDFLVGNIVIKKRDIWDFYATSVRLDVDHTISPVLPFARMDLSGRFCLRKNAPEFR